MDKITHKNQQEIWDKEHQNPQVLVQMNAEDASSGVIKFYDFLKSQKLSNLTGIEMGCGKGRNVIFLAAQKENKKVYGFDFSPAAISIAQERAKKAGVQSRVDFSVGDATIPWNFESESFDYAIDNFASTDIESKEGRESAIKEILRILRPGGFLMVYALTPDDGFHKEMIEKSPAEEKNAFYHTTGKFEKTFSKDELEEMYKGFKTVVWERVDKKTKFFGKEYQCHHYWMVFKKKTVTEVAAVK